tara:strand:+ start:16831 stop:17199 length:369 start_codon:yes stop_codon:yes gene_type:complete
MFKNPFSFKGRIRRTEYGITYLIYLAVSLLQELITTQLSDDIFSILLILLIWVPLIWFYLAQGAKRCHDRGNNGWYQIIPFYVFWMIFADSDYGPNEYGDNPKGQGNFEDIENIGKPLEIEE